MMMILKETFLDSNKKRDVQQQHTGETFFFPRFCKPQLTLVLPNREIVQNATQIKEEKIDKA
jgi:hypothetical protein